MAGTAAREVQTHSEVIAEIRPGVVSFSHIRRFVSPDGRVRYEHQDWRAIGDDFVDPLTAARRK